MAITLTRPSRRWLVMLLLPHIAGPDLRRIANPHFVPQGRYHLHEPLAVAGGLHADPRRCRQLPVKLLRISRGMYQFLLADLPGRFVKPRNLLPTGVKIASNKHHRRLLLPSQASWSSNYRVPGIETEPSFLSNQSFDVVERWGFALVPFLF